jgi:hypothetical protein
MSRKPCIIAASRSPLVTSFLQQPARLAPTVVVASLAIAAFAVGLAVYLFDRPPGSASLLPSAWQSGHTGLFGGIGAWLPSLVHAFTFSLLTALVLPRSTTSAALACAAWACIDTLAECAQTPALAEPLAAALTRTFGDGPVAAPLGRYFTQGSYDPADIVAGLAGAALAFTVLRCAGSTSKNESSS